MEQIIPLIVQINSIEQQIRDLKVQKQCLERELSNFLVGNDGVKDMRADSGSGE